MDFLKHKRLLANKPTDIKGNVLRSHDIGYDDNTETETNDYPDSNSVVISNKTKSVKINNPVPDVNSIPWILMVFQHSIPTDIKDTTYHGRFNYNPIYPNSPELLVKDYKKFINMCIEIDKAKNMDSLLSLLLSYTNDEFINVTYLSSVLNYNFNKYLMIYMGHPGISLQGHLWEEWVDVLHILKDELPLYDKFINEGTHQIINAFKLDVLGNYKITNDNDIVFTPVRYKVIKIPLYGADLAINDVLDVRSGMSRYVILEGTSPLYKLLMRLKDKTTDKYLLYTKCDLLCDVHYLEESELILLTIKGGFA